MPRTSAPAILALLLLAGPAGTASRSGEVEFTETDVKERTDRSIESSLLRGDPATAAGYLERTALHLFVAESASDWEQGLAPRLADALRSGPDAVADLADALPPGIAHAGPDIDGGVVRFTLPDGRGQGVVAVHLPDLLAVGKADRGATNAARPNRGGFVSGVSVGPDDDPEVVAIYLPSRPKGMTRGRPPEVEARPLPDDGRGDLTIFRGKGGSGDAGEELARPLQRLLERSRIGSDALRRFPKEPDDLVRDLRSARVTRETIEVEDSAYRTLSQEPDTWRVVSTKLAHPSRLVAFSAPVALELDSGERAVLIVGGVAWYTPLLMDPTAAHLYLGIGPERLFAAVHAGELPFLRDRGDVWLFRGHLDRWIEGRAREGRGKRRGTRDTARAVEELAAELGSRRLGRATGAPMPMRFVPIPADERKDPRRTARGRVHEDDLLAWLSHYDAKADLDGPRPATAFDPADSGALFEAGFEGGGGSGSAVATSEPERSSARRTGSSSGGPLLEVLDLYPLTATCDSGQPFIGVIEFVVDRIPDGETAELELAWSVSARGGSPVRMSTTLVREAGEHEVLFEAGCPGSPGRVELETWLSWQAADQSAEASAPVQSVPASGSSDGDPYD